MYVNKVKFGHLVTINMTFSITESQYLFSGVIVCNPICSYKWYLVAFMVVLPDAL
jgi:hypothetical protein